MQVIIHAELPTVDPEWIVANLEAEFGGPLAKQHKPKPNPKQEARVLGHSCARRDYKDKLARAMPGKEMPTRLFTSSIEGRDTFTLLRDETAKLSFQQRAEYLKEFGYAYSKTFTPFGELQGQTLATATHKKLFARALYSLIAGREFRPVAELREFYARERKRVKLSPVEELRRRDKDESELRRLQQICARLGWSFRPRRPARRRKQKTG